MRCYNGCPDSELAAWIRRNEDAIVELGRRIPGARCTYFPMEGKYQVYSAEHKPLSKAKESVISAVEEAIGELNA